MNIRLRAGVEVLLGTVGFIVVAVLVSTGLDYIMENYGPQAIIAGLGVVVLGIFMNLVYQIRVSQLKFEQNTKVDQ